MSRSSTRSIKSISSVDIVSPSIPLGCSGPNNTCPFTGNQIRQDHSCPFTKLLEVISAQQQLIQRLTANSTPPSTSAMDHRRQSSSNDITVKASTTTLDPSAWVWRGNSRTQLSPDMMTCTKIGTSRNQWNCNVMGSLGWTSGYHEWTIQLLTDAHLMIGVARPETNPDGPNWNSCGYYLSTQSGSLFGEDNVWKNDYGPKCYKKGTQITVKLDMDARTLAYAINGQDYGLAWKKLNSPTLPLFPSIDIDTGGSTFTLIHRK